MNVSAMLLQLGLATSRQKGDHGPILRHAKALTNRAAVNLHWNHVGQWMADIAAFDRRVAVQRRLEGIEGQGDMADRFYDPAHPLLSPGPD
jgi:hypothetical protein